jgi:hypothetical protein
MMKTLGPIKIPPHAENFSMLKLRIPNSIEQTGNNDGQRRS